MVTRRATEIILVAAVAALIAWNVYAVQAGGGQATISRVIHEASAEWPVLPFAMGVLVGHWFWPLRMQR